MSCTEKDKEIIRYDTDLFNNTSLLSISEIYDPYVVIHEGLVSQKDDTIRVVRDDETVSIIILSKPVLVAQAEKEENWGFFQFPKIFRADDGNLIVYWQMKPDSYTAYGEESYGYMMSKNEGDNWIPLDKKYFRKGARRVELNDGIVLQEVDPTPKDISLYSQFPKPINTEPIEGYSFYLESEIPNELGGVYLEYWDKARNYSDTIHARLNDPGYLRYAINGMMPIVWWGDIKELDDGSLIAGVYPTFYQNSSGNVLNTTSSFYQSNDFGHSWNLLGIIPHQKDVRGNPLLFDGSDGYCEPTYEILKNGSYICVLRTGSFSPMVKSFSNDNGRHWSEPEPFVPNGVLPRLMLLNNGVLALASGRPGLQLRFSINGEGNVWTEPIEMISFMDDKGNIDKWVSCGYPSLLRVGDNSFYMVYSNFKTKNRNGNIRKAIMFRRIEVIKNPYTNMPSQNG